LPFNFSPSNHCEARRAAAISWFIEWLWDCFVISVDNSMRSYYISAVKLSDFEWDDFKNAQNAEKHGVSFYEAQYAFADIQRVVIEDLDHGGDEDRFFCFGKVKGGVMTVRFTFREGRIRIIGAGYWRKGEEDL
jgi:uncharacterized protein